MANKKFIVPMSGPLSVGDDSEKIGNLSDLTTTDKTNIVSSINEVNGKFPVAITDGGTGGTTATEARTNLGVMTGVQLYYNASGSSGTIELSDSIENYQIIDIHFTIYILSKTKYGTARIYNSGASSVTTSLSMNVASQVTTNTQRITAFGGSVDIAADSLTRLSQNKAAITGTNTTETTETSTDVPKIYKIIGYKY